MQFKDVVEPYLTYCRVEKNHASETLIKLQDCFRAWLVPHFAQLELEELKPLNVLRFREAMVKKGLGTSRQYSVLMALKSFLKFCRTVLETNSLDPDSIRLPKRPRPQVQYLTNLEIGALRDSIDSSRLLGLRLRTLFEVLLTTGMRISEALQLDRDSIAPATNEATIIGKGNKPRAIFFKTECMAWIKKYISERRDVNPALFVTYGDHPKRLRRGDVPRFFMALAKSAGIDKHFTPHLLRHTFCTNLRNNGADISLIKELAGHQNIDTTARYYLSADKATLREAVRKYQNYSVELESSGAS